MEYLDIFLLQFQGVICRIGIGQEVTPYLLKRILK